MPIDPNPVNVTDTRPDPLETPEDRLIRAAAEWMLRDLATPQSVVEIREKFELTDYQFKEGFRRVYQTTPAAWLRQQRLSQAVNRLTETDETVAAIALGLGYQNPSRFAEAFRRAFGVTPSEFRRRSLAERPSEDLGKGPAASAR